MTDHDSGRPSHDDGSDDHVSRRKLIGGTAIGAAVVWTAQFPFADVAIGQTIGGSDGPTGPTGTSGATGGTGSSTVPVGPAESASGAAQGTLATTGVDAGAIAALGGAAAAAGGALVWFRSRGAGDDGSDGSDDASA